LSPKEGDIHQIRNAFDDRVSISIHVYGPNIGAVRCHVFQLDGTTKSIHLWILQWRGAQSMGSVVGGLKNKSKIGKKGGGL
jgi:hypothetical protein